MTTTKSNLSQYADEYAEQLRDLLPKGSTVRTVLRHVSRSGMSRNITVLVVDNGEIRDVSRGVASVLGWRLARNGEGVQVGGCGMDMGFHLVYSLAQALYGDGYALDNRWI